MLIQVLIFLLAYITVGDNYANENTRISLTTMIIMIKGARRRPNNSGGVAKWRWLMTVYATSPEFPLQQRNASCICTPHANAFLPPYSPLRNSFFPFLPFSPLYLRSFLVTTFSFPLFAFSFSYFSFFSPFFYLYFFDSFHFFTFFAFSLVLFPSILLSQLPLFTLPTPYSLSITIISTSSPFPPSCSPFFF